MQAFINELQHLSHNNQIKMTNTYFDRVVNRFSFFFNNEDDNIKGIMKLEQKSNILMLDKCNELDNQYVIACVDDILLLITYRKYKTIDTLQIAQTAEQEVDFSNAMEK